MTHVPASSHGSTFNGGTITNALVVDSADTPGDVGVLWKFRASAGALPIFQGFTSGDSTWNFRQDGANLTLAKQGGDNPGNIVRLREYDVLFYNNAGNSHILKTSRENDGLGLFGKTPAPQPAAIPDAAGGVVIDAEARTALNALLAAARTLGLIAT